MASFEKELKRTDEGSMLVIPTRFARNHMRRVEGGRSENITVVDVGGSAWKFGYYVRRHRNPRPVLRSGWRRYVFEKGLKVGDRIIFERVDGFPELYRIGARRRIKLFGKEVWTDVF
ncbi:hypothetical protein SLEP1_g60101 [Rubroshorea leprosula]|uniref:TF-B3 domain-containing protein n=1 Tax=Rubroshorea leprosula TaxID=152421 RepID=A0AAV5MYW0_9ROSI|nr:hypothetical protein SLEP1_g60101 [Rubroshorea leprosula]